MSATFKYDELKLKMSVSITCSDAGSRDLGYWRAIFGFQCFDAVGWAAGRASGLKKKLSGWVLA